MSYPPCVNGGCSDRACCTDVFRVSWPELVGTDADSAIGVIKQSNPLVTVLKVPQGQAVSSDFCCNRVYLFFDPNNNVATIPQVG